MDVSAKSVAVIARESRKRASLAGWRAHGTTAGAAKCGKVGAATIKRWHREDAEYAAAVKVALDEYAVTAGQETHNALVEHVRAARRGDMVLTKRGTGEHGRPIEIFERVTMNPAICRLILTRADPRFTHPKQEIEHAGGITLRQALAELDALEAPPPMDAQAIETV